MNKIETGDMKIKVRKSKSRSQKASNESTLIKSHFQYIVPQLRLVHPREVFKAALLSNAFAIIVAHNHPSGIVEASSEDIATTKQLISAGKIMGVSVVDHCIVGFEKLNSLRESMPFLWRE